MSGEGSEAAELGRAAESVCDPAGGAEAVVMRMNSNPAPWILKTEAPSWSPIARLAGHHQTSTTELVYR